MEQGKVSWAYSNFLDYKKTEEEIEIVPEEVNVEIDVVSELVNKLINSNSKIAQDQEKY